MVEEDLGFEDYDDDEFSISRTPTNNDRDTLRERLNPYLEIEKFKLSLMGAYKVVKSESDGRGGFHDTVLIKKMKGFIPMLNKQGIEEIVDYVKDLVNSHTFQSYIVNIEDYNVIMRFTLNRMMVDFVAKRFDWGLKDPVTKVLSPVSLTNIRYIYSKARNLIKITLRRPIGNKERESITETVRETRSTGAVSSQQKPNILQQVAGAFK